MFSTKTYYYIAIVKLSILLQIPTIFGFEGVFYEFLLYVWMQFPIN